MLSMLMPCKTASYITSLFLYDWDFQAPYKIKLVESMVRLKTLCISEIQSYHRLNFQLLPRLSTLIFVSGSVDRFLHHVSIPQLKSLMVQKALLSISTFMLYPNLESVVLDNIHILVDNPMSQVSQEVNWKSLLLDHCYGLLHELYLPSSLTSLRLFNMPCSFECMSIGIALPQLNLPHLTKLEFSHVECRVCKQNLNHLSKQFPRLKYLSWTTSFFQVKQVDKGPFLLQVADTNKQLEYDQLGMDVDLNQWK
jgi:hypothetical protein